MNLSMACDDVSIMNRAGGISLILKSAGPAGEALDQALRAAGFRVRVAPTVFDVVTEAQRAKGAFQHLFVGVDHWGPAEFRLLPLVRREWPGTTIVAYCSPGFACKGRVAELVGADAVLNSIGEIMHFIEGLAPLAEPAQPAPVAPAPASRRAESPPPVAAAAVPPAGPVDTTSAEVACIPEPPPPAPDTTRPPASPVQSIPLMQPEHAGADVDDAANADGIDGEIVGTIELTDEELRLLLGEDEEA